MMKYLVIDGNFFMYRAIHKMGELRRSDGLDTGMEYGFLRMLKTTVNEIKPNRTYVVFDAGLSPRRLQLLPEYKANREKKKEASGRKGRKDILIKMLESLGIGCFMYDGVEADDIIGLVSGLMEDGEELIIASSDTDFCQLIKDNVKVYNPIKKEYLESPVDPVNYVTYKAMIGDTADNIPGIKGIGPKKALKKMDGDWTSEEGDIISRNEQIILIPDDIEDFESLFYPKLPDFEDSFNDWMNREIPKDFESFFRLCREMEFCSIENNRVSWQGTFGKNVTLDGLW